MIRLEDGRFLNDLDDLKPEVCGYKIVHQLTGRILPSTTRKEIYSKAAAIKKMDATAQIFNMHCTPLDIWDYALEPIYDFEKPDDCIYINDKDDNLF